MLAWIKSVVVLILSNAVGMGLAALLLGPGFRLGIAFFLVAVLVFTAVAAAAQPLLARFSRDRLPQLMGGVSLLAVFVGLVITQFVVSDKLISGVGNWLMATLLVWVISLAGQLLLPKLLFAPKPGPDKA